MIHMKKIPGRTVLGVSVLMVAISASLVADPPPPLHQPTVIFHLTDVGLPGRPSLHGVYTSPYTGHIDSGIDIPVICDDFSDNSYVPEDWTAYSTALSSINLGATHYTTGDLKWNNANSGGDIIGGSTYAGWNLNQQAAYNVAAYLAIKIIQTSATVRQNYSFALWELFAATPGQSSSNGTSSAPNDKVVTWLNARGAPGMVTLNAASQYVEDAIVAVCGSAGGCTTDGTTHVTSLNGTPTSILSGWNVNLYSFASCTVGTANGRNCSSAPQEFITATPVTVSHTNVPESPSLGSLAAYLLFGGGALFFSGRRRFVLSAGR